MKLNKILIPCGAMIVAATLLVSCKKEKGQQIATEQYDYNNKSLVQVYNATVGAARNYIYVDNVPVTGAALAYAGTFPSTPSDFAVTSGLRDFLIKDTLSTTTQPPLSIAENLQPGGNYTIFMYDTLNAAKYKTVANDIIIPDDTTARVRFANFVYGPATINMNVDIWSNQRAANIFTNVPVTSVTNFISFASSKTDTLVVRLAGTGVNLTNKTSSTSSTPVPVQIIVNPTRKRSYTLIFRGSFRNDVGGSATVRSLSFFSGN
jgi:hypothetical protein